MAEVDPKLCIALDDINEAMDCENQDNMGGIIPSVIFGYHADVATWPDYPKKTESPLSLEEAGTLVGDLVMKESCRAYKMDFTDELAEFKITDQGESGGESFLMDLNIISAKMRKKIFGFENATKGRKMFFIDESPAGNEVFSTSQDVILSEGTPVATSFSLKKPELWSVDTPVLYTAEVSLSSDGKEYDKISVPFGIRTLSFSAEKGFLLNGKSMKLKGGCVHHDNGLLGAAAIDRAEERKVELMKANGYNAVRCAHNQVSEYFLDACDRLGMLVIHETFDQWQKAKREQDYHQFFDEWSDWDLAASVRRDRNHPSIIMWSIGNEVEQRADEPEGDLISRKR